MCKFLNKYDVPSPVVFLHGQTRQFCIVSTCTASSRTQQCTCSSYCDHVELYMYDGIHKYIIVHILLHTWALSNTEVR